MIVIRLKIMKIIDKSGVFFKNWKGFTKRSSAYRTEVVKKIIRGQNRFLWPQNGILKTKGDIEGLIISGISVLQTISKIDRMDR